MRGKVRLRAVSTKICRITPAYAGKSHRSAGVLRDSKDHPRLCGEKTKLIDRLRPIIGSPPPMRGKGKMAVQVNRENRITPAYAGKRERFDLFSAGIWDHPRLCGEKLLPVVLAVKCEGSPPPMRGKA